MIPVSLPVQLFAGRSMLLPQSGRPSAISKQLLNGPVRILHNGLVGDEQADRRVHGGPDKAVHLYPPGHYERLSKRFPELAGRLRAGGIGENISPSGFDESAFQLGDIVRLGEARLQFCQPRTPCWKIDEHFDCEGVAVFIAEHGLAGWYLRVVGEGEVAPGDRLELLEPAAQSFSLADALRLTQAHRPDLAQFTQLCQLPFLADGWRSKLRSRLAWLEKQASGST